MSRMSRTSNAQSIPTLYPGSAFALPHFCHATVQLVTTNILSSSFQGKATHSADTYLLKMWPTLRMWQRRGNQPEQDPSSDSSDTDSETGAGKSNTPSTSNDNWRILLPLSQFDVASVRFLLSSPLSPLRNASRSGQSPPHSGLKALPSEVVSIIFDHAEFHVCRAITFKSYQSYSGDANDLYFRSKELDGVFDKGCIRKVEITVDSHDQGWSDEPRSMHGTHQGSWTWFEATLDRPKPTSEPETDGQAMPNEEPSSLASENGEAAASEDYEELIRCEVVRNWHAKSKFAKQSVTFGPDHPIVQQARRGDRIGIWARTMFVGWQNFVQEVEIKVWQPY